MHSLTRKQSLFVGVTLFSMFFGAGNLIIPPLLGLQAGQSVVPAMVGFLVVGIGLPVVGIVAVGLAGTLKRLASRVHPAFAAVFVAAIYLAIGPCMGIPRTSSTSFEMLMPLLPEDAPVQLIGVAFSVLFFGAAYLLAMHPGKLTALFGKLTGPALIALIVMVVGAALLDLADAAPAARGAYTANAGMQGFLTGYQTMDLLASLTFGLVIAENIRAYGVTDDAGLTREVARAGVFAGVLMGLIYCGLAFVGLSMAPVMPGATNGAQILTASASVHFGVAGTVLVAAIFLLACLNVCISLISCCATYFSELLPRIPYKAWALAFAVFSCAVSNVGLDAILAFSVPLLTALYPVAIVLVLMGVAYRLFDRMPKSWPFAVAVTTVVSVACSARDAFFANTWLPFDVLPLAQIKLQWVVPMLVALAVGCLVSRMRPAAVPEEMLPVEQPEQPEGAV